MVPSPANGSARPEFQPSDEEKQRQVFSENQTRLHLLSWAATQAPEGMKISELRSLMKLVSAIVQGEIAAHYQHGWNDRSKTLPASTEPPEVGDGAVAS